MSRQRRPRREGSTRASQNRRRGESRLQLLIDLLKLGCLDRPNQDVSSDAQYHEQESGSDAKP